MGVMGRAKKVVVRKRVGASRRCLQILEILAGQPYVFSLGDVSAALAMPKTSVYRLLNLLTECGFVEQEAGTRRYLLTPKVLWIGTSYLRSSAVERCSLTLLSQLSERTGTTSHLAVWDSDTALILHTEAPPNAMSLFVDVGERRPVHATALGKVLLAFRPPGDWKRIGSKGLPQLGPKTITSLPVLEEQLARIRETGYAIADEEIAPGIRSVAAPIRNAEGVVAAVNIRSELSLMTNEALPRMIKLVQEAALRISVQLGYRPSVQVGVLRPLLQSSGMGEASVAVSSDTASPSELSSAR
jgi:IclR family pca regulon transcriptional regulator